MKEESNLESDKDDSGLLNIEFLTRVNFLEQFYQKEKTVLPNIISLKCRGRKWFY